MSKPDIVVIGAGPNGLVAACVQAKTPMFLAGYPITPASDILHAMSRYKRFGVMTLQAEDEISAICAAIGAAYAGQIAVTTTSGPGMALKSEAIGLAVATELPLVIVDIQRGGPSTGLPTKTEQADLFQALWGRNSEAPVPVIAARTPGDYNWASVFWHELAHTFHLAASDNKTVPRRCARPCTPSVPPFSRPPSS